MSTLMTVGETARRLQKCSETIRAWERRGWLPAVRTESGMRLFRREDVDRMVDELAGRERERAETAR